MSELELARWRAQLAAHACESFEVPLHVVVGAEEALTSWAMITEEMRADYPYVSAQMEWVMLAISGRPPLTVWQRVAGRRAWTASNGYKLTFYVTWRRALMVLESKLRRT